MSRSRCQAKSDVSPQLYGLSPRATHTVQCMFLAGRLDDYLKRQANIDDHRHTYIDNLQNVLLEKAGSRRSGRSYP